MSRVEEKLAEIRRQDRESYEKKDYSSMALKAIDRLCISVEDGMDAKEALDLIYRFAHSAHPSICYDVHDDWRKELVEFYEKYILDDAYQSRIREELK